MRRRGGSSHGWHRWTQMGRRGGDATRVVARSAEGASGVVENGAGGLDAVFVGGGGGQGALECVEGLFLGGSGLGFGEDGAVFGGRGLDVGLGEDFEKGLVGEVMFFGELVGGEAAEVVGEEPGFEGG